MSETRAPYIAKVVFTDDPAANAITKTDNTIMNSDTAEALRLFEAAGLRDHHLLALARACVEARENGFGAVMARWVNGQPLRLRVMKSKTWR